MQCVGMVWIGLEDLFVEFFSLCETAGLMVADGECEELIRRDRGDWGGWFGCAGAEVLPDAAIDCFHVAGESGCVH